MLFHRPDRPGIASLVLFSVLLPILPMQPAGAGGTTADDPPLELPHRRGRLVVDGHLDDWTGPALRVEFSDPVAVEPQANRALVRLAWDEEHLWAAIEVRDGEVFAPPEGIAGARLYQWDSVELYLDSGGNAGPRMDPDDFQFLISCDGRWVVFQGDAVLGTCQWQAPKNVREALAIETAASPTPGGYTVECAIPLAAIGFQDTGTHPVVGLDLAWNDWTEDHDPLPEPELSAENLRTMLEGPVDVYSLADADAAEVEAALKLKERAYRPWSWSGQRDFGYPSTWHRVVFSGRPPLGELVVQRVGAGNLVLILVLGMALATTILLFTIQRRHRRRVQALLLRLEQLSGDSGAGSTPGSGPPATPEDGSAAGLSGLLSTAMETGAVVAVENEALSSRALAALIDSPGDIASVSDLARTLHVSLRTLQRGLKTELDCSPSELILAVKMRLAHQRLSGGRRRVREVARELGYDSPEHFSRRFKTYYRYPPSKVPKNPEKPV